MKEIKRTTNLNNDDWPLGECEDEIGRNRNSLQ